jgi:hypothetical protein
MKKQITVSKADLDKMAKIIEKLFTTKNELVVNSAVLPIVKESFSNPIVSVGIVPYYGWSKVKKVSYIVGVSPRRLYTKDVVYDIHKHDDRFKLFKTKGKAMIFIMKKIQDHIAHVNKIRKENNKVDF